MLIERAKIPFGFAIPAGHVDNDTTYEAAAVRELTEEVGLTADSLTLLVEGREENPCRRGGSWHYWKVYEVSTKGEPERSMEETKKMGWYSPEDVRILADRTEQYKTGSITEDVWEREPGLEPVMYDLFKKLQLI